ncbi:hypothetical protein BpHYR1_013798 [Brachionus plicatilis]|uniref:Uncharacterized protein n=1 Tax=Brachionus plicatilis TaxID=10195 RepID=A0A3M7SWR3_BRAPC|nr:hypothetical protein BpHYR1_013798 [Brachionus plicatilis]
MSEKTTQELNETFDSSSSLLKESLMDIVLKSSDKHFKLHSLAKLNLNGTSEQEFEQKLDFLFNRLREKYLKMNSNEKFDSIDDDFSFLEKIDKIKKENFNEEFYHLDVDLGKNKKIEDFDSDFIFKNNTDDFEKFENFHQKKHEDFEYFGKHDFF